MSLMSLTAVELGKKIQAGEVTAIDAAKEALQQIKDKEDQINSFVTVLGEEAVLARAKEVQEQIEKGELTGPLAGVPVAIKDNMCTEGVLTTCSSRILENFVPTYSSEAVVSVVLPMANSSILVLPRITAPAFSRLTTASEE